MRVMEAIGVTDSIAASSFAHLRQLNPMPVFILSPRSGAAHAARLDLVGVWVHLEFAASVAGSAAGVSFHDLPPGRSS